MGKPQEYYSTDRTKMAYFLPKQYQTVLEIGCGEGLFRTSLARGCEYWGIEPYAPAAAVASKGDGKILIGMFDEVFNQLPDHYFDLVVCNDVIEHMVDHDQFFESIKLKMKMDACLVGSVPNVRYIQNLFKLLFRRDWQYKEAGILDSTHLRFFTKKSLLRSLHNGGFCIEEFEGINGLPLKLSPFPLLVYNLLTLILGSDTRFLQFGFRIRQGNPTS